MSKPKYKQEGNLEEINNIKVSDILIDTDDFLEYYEKDDIKAFSTKLKDTKLPNFDTVYKVLRKYKNINTISNLNDATVEYITNKRYEIRNAINTVIGVKDKHSDYKRIWKEIESLSLQMYERSKDKMLLIEDIKTLKNNDLRLSEVNFRLLDLVKLNDKIELIMARFKQVDDEIKDTLLYLQDVKEEISRIQSGIQLALDTGEIEKVYWKKNNEF